MEKKVITILFSRYHTFMANFLHIVSGRGYTHASIALDEDDEYFYSFNSKGFRKEYPKKHKNRNAKCVGFRLEISKEAYERIKATIEKFEAKKDKLYYSNMGIFCCFFQIPYKKQDRYFCSQFVAEVLHRCEVLKLKKKSSLYFPKDFLKHKELKLVFQGNHLGFVEKYVMKKSSP